jgi:hypothetical protein
VDSAGALVNDDASLMDVRRKVSEMEEAFEELAERQGETDASIVRVLDVLQRIEQNQRRQMEAQGVRPIDG